MSLRNRILLPPPTGFKASFFQGRVVPAGRAQRSQSGYILLTLLLLVAVLAIAAAAMVPMVTFEMKRDREQELIHRGVQYSRAVRRYFKKFGRYPTRIEDLQTTSNIHYLRKAYKDPITGKDFKLLHIGDVQMSFFGPGGTGTPPNGMTGNPGAAAGAGFTQATIGAAMAAAGQGGQATGLNGAPSPDSSDSTNAKPSPGDETPGGADNSAAGAAASASGQSAAAGQGAPNSGTSGGFGSSSNQTFGGGPIVGVASTSKAKSIRQFNKKDHYDQWQFIYDPSNDRGGLITTPNQPALQGAAPLGQPVNGQPGASPSGSGQTGNPGGFGGNGNQSNQSSPQPVQQQPQTTPDSQQ
jgi:type II secretory pathway pseudopilin PulG